MPRAAELRDDVRLHLGIGIVQGPHGQGVGFRALEFAQGAGRLAASAGLAVQEDGLDDGHGLLPRDAGGHREADGRVLAGVVQLVEDAAAVGQPGDGGHALQVGRHGGGRFAADLAHQVMDEARVAPPGEHGENRRRRVGIVQEAQQQPQDAPLRALGQHVDRRQEGAVVAVAQHLPQGGVLAVGQQQETLDDFAALVLAEAVDRRFQAAQHVAADHLRIAAVARVAAAGQFLAQRLHQLQRRLGGQFGVGLRGAVQHREQRGQQVVVAEHDRRAAALLAQVPIAAQDGVAKGAGHAAAVLADDGFPFRFHPRHAVEDFPSSGGRAAFEQGHQRALLDGLVGAIQCGDQHLHRRLVLGARQQFECGRKSAHQGRLWLASDS